MDLFSIKLGKKLAGGGGGSGSCLVEITPTTLEGATAIISEPLEPPSNFLPILKLNGSMPGKL